MASCPNVQSKQWLDLVDRIGQFEAMREFIINAEEIPDYNNYLQVPDSESSKASSETINKVKEWLKNIGVNINEVPYINSKGERIDANGRAKILENFIDIVEGKQNIALVEEAMHFATYIIQQANPTLYKQMLNKIESYDAYKTIFDTYKAVYTKDGKPDIPKIKFEAIGKILAEYYIQTEEGSTTKPELLEQRRNWIERIIDWFKSNILKYGNPFLKALIEVETAGPIKQRAFSLTDTDVSIQTTIDQDNQELEGGAIHRTKVLDKLDDVGQILSENDGTYLTVFDTDIRSLSPNTGTMAYLRLAQEAKSQGLILRSDRISDRMSDAAKALWGRFIRGGQAEVQDNRYVFIGDPTEVTEGVFLQINSDNLITKLDKTSSEISQKEFINEKGEPDKAYFIGLTQVKTRVTRYVKSLLKSKFDKERSLQEKTIDDQKKDWGTKGHKDVELLIRRFLTSEGKLVKVSGQLVPQNTESIKSEMDPRNIGLFSTLQEYVTDLLTSYPEDTVFRLEQPIYSDRGGKTGERDIAGTVDFMAILPDGKRDILDWKFISINKEKYGDIAWYKQNEWNLQMLEYKKILKRDYGLRDVDFGKTRMIPFVLTYEGIGQGKNRKVIPSDIETAGQEIKIDEKTYLLPVVTSDELTGDAVLDNLVHRLTGLYNTLKDLPAGTQRTIKNEQLNNLFKAIRHLQVARNFSPLTEQVGILIKDSERVITEHKEKFEKLEDLSEIQISEQASNLLLKAQALNIYQNLDNDFKDFYGENPTKEELAILTKIVQMTSEARRAYTDINNVVKSFGEKYIASRRNVEDLLKAEKTVTGVTRFFGTTSELPTAAMQTLFLMVDNANNKIQFELNDAKDELVELKAAVDKWGGLKKALSLIKRQPEGHKKGESDEVYKRRLSRESNKLIDEYDSEFYDDLREAIENTDLDWIKANLDMDALKKNFREHYTETKKIIEETRYSYDDLENEDKKRQALEKLALTTDPTKFEAFFEKDQYYILKKFPTEQWRSEEYKELKKNESVFKFYKFIRKWNKAAKEIGYLDDTRMQERNFLPYLYKSFSEKLNLGGEFSFGDWLVSSLSIDPNIAGYGQFNELTGQIEDSIPTYFTSEIENKEQVSEDLFLNIAAYVKAVVNYQYKSEIDGQVKALYFIEQNKSSLRVDTFGNLIKINGVPEKQASNDPNADLLLNHIKSLQYGQKYTSVESTDALLGDWAKGFNKFSDKTNKVLGFNILPHLQEGKQVSLTRFMDTINRFFTVKNMGLNVATSASVLAGGNFQAIINSGRYYTKEQFLASEFQHAAHRVFKNDKVHLALIKTLMPIDEELNREINKLSAGKFTANSFADFMLFMMRKSDHIVQYANFLAFMKNTIVQDGKLVNAREFYRNSPEYSNRYNLTQTERSVLEANFDKKIDELLAKQGVIEIAEVDGKGNLAIPGVKSIKDDNIFSYRTLINSIGKRATGNVSPENEMLIRMNAIFRSMLVFKNWIPGLIKQRVGGLRFDSATQTYEYGRLRMLIKHLGPLALFKIKDITNILKANDKGVSQMKEFFKNQKESYTNKTDKELNLQESEFIDMFRQNLKNQIKELGILVSMIAIVTTILPLFKPDDDEEQEVRNRFKFASRLVDKVKDEVWFYYNPVGLQQILNGSIFPALGIFTDAARVIESTMTEIYGVSVDEELTEKNYALKNLMKALPLTKELTYYIAMFDAELAKELGIKISSQSRMK